MTVCIELPTLRSEKEPLPHASYTFVNFGVAYALIFVELSIGLFFQPLSAKMKLPVCPLHHEIMSEAYKISRHEKRPHAQCDVLVG